MLSKTVSVDGRNVFFEKINEKDVDETRDLSNQ